MKQIIMTEEQIEAACNDIALKLSNELKDEEKTPIVLGVMKGAVNFLMALTRKISVPIYVDYIQVSSYVGTSTTGNIKMVKDINFDIKNRTVVIVEDIVDTGYSMEYLVNHIKSYGAKKVIITTLIDKACARKNDIKPDYAGLVMNENKFIVGFGLDYNELCRNIPYIYAVDHEELIRLDNILAKDRK